MVQQKDVIIISSEFEAAIKYKSGGKITKKLGWRL